MQELLKALTELALEARSYIKSQGEVNRIAVEASIRTQNKVNGLDGIPTAPPAPVAPAAPAADDHARHVEVATANAKAQVEATAPKKGRPKKEAKEEAAPKAQEPEKAAETGDPLAPQAQPAAKAEAPKEMTEAESKAEADAAAQAYVNKFPKMDAGLTAARKIMAEEFKVVKFADLTHPQRIAIAKRFREEAAKL